MITYGAVKSIVYPQGFPRDGSGKLFLYAYGAYGHAIPPSFSTGRLSLLDPVEKLIPEFKGVRVNPCGARNGFGDGADE